MSQTFIDPDAGKSPEQLYAERMQRLQDAVALKQPDRVPVSLMLGYMLAEIGGVTRQELQDNNELAQGLLEKTALKFQPDIASGVFGFGPGASIALGDQMTKWPGHGLDRERFLPVRRAGVHEGRGLRRLPGRPLRLGHPHLPAARLLPSWSGLATLPPFGMLAFGFYHTCEFDCPTPRRRWLNRMQALSKAIQATLRSPGHA